MNTSIKQSDVSYAAMLSLIEACDKNHLVPKSSLDIFLQSQDKKLDPNKRVSELQLINLWKLIQTNEQIPEIGLKIGQTASPEAKGLLASWVSQAENLKEALSIFNDNIVLMNPSEQWKINQQDKHYSLTFSFLNDQYPIADIERSMSALIYWGRLLSGTQLLPIRANFKFAKPSYSDLYQPLFGNNLIFNAQRNELIIAENDLLAPIINSNSMLKALIAEKLKAR